MKFRFDPPFIVKKVFSDFHWDTANGKVLITFDDGPVPGVTEKILNKLAEHKVKALFFCVGENIERHPEISKKILDEGHSIGNHSYNHKRLTRSPIKEAEAGIKKFNNLMMEKYNYKIEYFRPPHGRFNFSTQRLMNRMKLENVMWSLLTYDYKNEINLVKFAVEKYLEKNSIVVLHDSLKSDNVILESLDFIFEQADKKGMQIGEPAECLKG